MSEEDQPPEEIWLDPEAINEHFERVKARWKSGSSAGMEPIEQPPMVDNELTRGLRG